MQARTHCLALLTLLAGCKASAPAIEPGPVLVAACQIFVDGDREAAFLRIDEALAEAAAQGADLACFPEACLLGWLNPEAHQLGDPIPGRSTERLAELAERHGIMIAIGLVEKDRDLLYDSAVLIDSDRSLLLRHRKVNTLPNLMDPPYSAGNGVKESFVDTRFGRICLLISSDTFDDVAVRHTAIVKPDLLLVPYGWAAPESSWPEHGKSLHNYITHTARRIKAPVVGVDSVGKVLDGPWKGNVLGGQSAACDAGGWLFEPLADREPEVRVFDLGVLVRSEEPED